MFRNHSEEYGSRSFGRRCFETFRVKVFQNKIQDNMFWDYQDNMFLREMWRNMTLARRIFACYNLQNFPYEYVSKHLGRICFKTFRMNMFKNLSGQVKSFRGHLSSGNYKETLPKLVGLLRAPIFNIPGMIYNKKIRIIRVETHPKKMVKKLV